MDTPPAFKRVNLLLRQTDWDQAEKLRAKMGEKSVSSTLRKLIRKAAKELPK